MENKKKIFLVILSVIIIVVIVVCVLLKQGIISFNNICSKKTEYTIANTNVKLNIKSDMKLYDDTKEITEKYGDDLAKYCDLIIVAENEKVELDISLLNKSLLDNEHSIDELLVIDVESTKEYGYKPTDITEEKYGNYNFKTYSYEYEHDGAQFISSVYAVDIGDKFLFVDAYTELSNKDQVVQVMEKLF